MSFTKCSERNNIIAYININFAKQFKIECIHIGWGILFILAHFVRDKVQLAIGSELAYGVLLIDVGNADGDIQVRFGVGPFEVGTLVGYLGVAHRHLPCASSAFLYAKVAFPGRKRERGKERGTRERKPKKRDIVGFFL